MARLDAAAHERLSHNVGAAMMRRLAHPGSRSAAAHASRSASSAAAEA
jgi:hypothetical protein